MEFAYMMGGERVEVVMTSVLGHVMGMDFGPQCKNWNNTPIESLFSENIVESVSEVSGREIGRLLIFCRE